MKDTEKGLKRKLTAHFSGHGQRMNMLVMLILGLLKLGTISYPKLSKVINPKVKRASNFKRIQRFMKQFSFCQKAYIQLVWSLFVSDENGVALTIDRTNWKFGSADINILMLGISYKGTAIPLVWKLLDKRGNSSTAERIALMERLCKCLTDSQKEKVRCLLADREFIGKDWIAYLKRQTYTFVIRTRANTKIQKIGKSKAVAASAIFTKEQFKVLRKERLIWGLKLFVAGQKISDNEWLILISDKPLSAGKVFYGERWGIEVFFAACKTRGFNFEDTHVTKLERIFNLLFLIAIAFIWALKTGEWLIENGHTIPIKKIRKRKVKLYSIFRIGFDHLQEHLLNFLAIPREIRLLSCT